MPNIKVANYEFTTPPAGEVVSLALVKSNARVDFAEEDTIIQLYIDMAVDRVSKLTGRLLQPAVLNGFYSYPDASPYASRLFVAIEKAPVIAINEVAVWDGTAYIALSSTDWSEEKTATYSRILFDTTVIFNNSLNYDELQPYPIRVGFDAGYPTSADIPPSLVGAVMQYATWLYVNRGDCSDCDGGDMIPTSIAGLLSPYIIRRVFA